MNPSGMPMKWTASFTDTATPSALGSGPPSCFGGKDAHPSVEKERAPPGLPQAGEPVERRVRVATPHRFYERRDDIVMLLTGLVVQEGLFLHRLCGDGERFVPYPLFVWYGYQAG